MPRVVPILPQEELTMKWKPRDLGKALRAKRTAMGLSQEQLGKELGVHRSSVSEWEQGKIPVCSVRLVSWMLSDGLEGSAADLWRLRAQAAEAALKDVTVALTGYRERVRMDLTAHRDAYEEQQGSASSAQLRVVPSRRE